MHNRWKMNRMGFVNFWLYDEETFDLCDGKILLRGQNGAGKSIATQSFIPFILDGDKTPRRLDPFGTKDRRMEYYFLGEGEWEKDESTGYLFLEFIKPETKQYRTIGIGQRAQRGKPMSFWGFILLDGRRIGYDLELYREVGSTKIPYSKQDLKKVLGEQAVFTDVQGEYKALVNKHLFGFPRMDQYEQFIQLLIKVRAPKLSNVFKPKTVYEILNDSLQTLTDEDLRAMVEAMEKMDGIQGNLENLQEALKETQIIRTEYTRYNQFMLGRKAQAYLKEKRNEEETQAKLEADETRLAGCEEERGRREEEGRIATEKMKLLETEMETLGDQDLDSAADRLRKAQAEKEEAQEEAARLGEEIELRRDHVRQSEFALKDIADGQYLCRKELSEQREQFENLQETALFSDHGAVLQTMDQEACQDSAAVRQALRNQIQEIEKGVQSLREHGECARRFDRAMEELERQQAAERELEAKAEAAASAAEDCRESMIEQYYRIGRASEELKLSAEQLQKLEQLVSGYKGEVEESQIKALLESQRDSVRSSLQAAKADAQYREKECRRQLHEKEEELRELLSRKDVEPPRRERTEEARRMLEAAGIPFVPFFKAVEFSPALSEKDCALLEAQLLDAGILDALILTDEGKKQIGEALTDFSDVFLQVKEDGRSGFDCLTPNEELSADLKRETRRILSNIYRAEEGEAGLTLGGGGRFRNGILSGISFAEDSAAYIGVLARKRKRQQLLSALEEAIAEQKQILEDVLGELRNIACRQGTLEAEYQNLPDFRRLREALAEEQRIGWQQKQVEDSRKRAEAEAQKAEQEKNAAFQRMLGICRRLPYERTLAAYEDARKAMEEYRDLWIAGQQVLSRLANLLLRQNSEQEKIDREEEEIDHAHLRARKANHIIKESDTRIRELQAYLDRPENRERARRLLQVKQDLAAIGKTLQEISNRRAVLENEISHLRAEREETRSRVEEAVRREKAVRACFEEELDLKLVLARQERSLAACAKAALEKLRESDRNREPSDVTASLLRVFQQHNGNLSSYGTTLEDCFGDACEELEDGMEHVLRRRVLFTAAWNGKKMQMEAFYQTLKDRIEETELLIQQKDRELFEEILSKTLSQQLTDRIAESRRWVADMSRLMKAMDTSMGLSFSLDWKPKSAETGQQLDTDELEKLLLRDKNLLTPEDMEKVAAHFRSKIHLEKQRAEEAGESVNYMDMVREALDYRKWFDFQMAYYRNQEGKKPLTDGAFNRFSGGEKAMAMYVPLLAALNAQYQKAGKDDHPRIVAMDEAFAGVDDRNISIMFALVGQLDFDYIMNSQALWGCYETVPALRICELHRPANSQMVSVINYAWNGKERILDV